MKSKLARYASGTRFILVDLWVHRPHKHGTWLVISSQKDMTIVLPPPDVQTFADLKDDSFDDEDLRGLLAYAASVRQMWYQVSRRAFRG